MRRSLLIGTLAAAVITLIASVSVAATSFGGPASGPASGVSMMRGRSQGQGAGMMSGQAQSQGAGMMGGDSGGQGAGMMGGRVHNQGAGMMGGSMMGSMGGMVWLPGDGAKVSSIPAARARAAKAAVPVGLRPGEVMRFRNGFYVELKDGAGNSATEVLVDPRSGSVSTEPGPAMMWNTRYGMHARGGGAAVEAGGVDATKARAIATSWLATSRADTTIGSIDTYPGYFTVDLKRNGVVSGMMSVSSGSGAAWYHTWHGAFIAMEET